MEMRWWPQLAANSGILVMASSIYMCLGSYTELSTYGDIFSGEMYNNNNNRPSVILQVISEEGSMYANFTLPSRRQGPRNCFRKTLGVGKIKGSAAASTPI